MSFNSLQFLIFLPAVITVYFLIPHRFRWVLLLISSYYFYMSWKPEYAVLIMFSTLIDYIAGIQIHKAQTPRAKKMFLGLSLLVNLGLLFSFKYFNFFSDSLRQALSLISIPFNPLTLKVLLPVGISFYTFQSLSYIIDVYRGRIKPERHLGIFALFISYFPQLVAGPIERAENLLPQFLKKQHFDYQRVVDGLKYMLWGFFQKMVIADNLAVVVDKVYGNVGDFTGIPLILATVFFAFQIFCDFAGYSNIAIGAAKIMGIDLMANFRRPYFANSITDFWRRWHISLCNWFRDYLYIPLGGNRVALPRWYLNLMIVFLVSGLWHGANWTFIVWGGLNGFYMVFEAATAKFKNAAIEKLGLNKFPKINNFIQIGTTFVLANIAWIFFRADSLSDAFYVLTHLFSNISLNIFNISGDDIGLGWAALIIALGSLALMESVHSIQEWGVGVRRFLGVRPAVVRWSAYLAVLMIILLFGSFKNATFIYFQF